MQHNPEIIPIEAREIIASFGEINDKNIDALRKALVASEIVSTFKAAQETIIDRLRKEEV